MKRTSKIMAVLLVFSMLLQIGPSFTPVVALAAETQTIDFSKAGYNYSNATLANSGWEVNREKSSVISDGVSLNDIRENNGNNYAGYRAWFADQTLTFNFSINADGYYRVSAVPALVFGAADGCTADILIDGIRVGGINWAVNASGDAQYPTVVMDAIELKADAVHTLTIKRTNASGGQYGGFRSITFAPIEDSVEQKINFLASGYDYNSATIANSGWEVNRSQSSVITDGVGGNNIRAGVGADYRAWFAGQTLTFDLSIKADGYYQVSVVPALIFGATDGCVADILINDVKVGSINWAVNASGNAQYPTVVLDAVELKGGAINKLTIKRTNESGGQWADIQSITFTPTEKRIEHTINFGANAKTINDVTIANHGWQLNKSESTSAAISGSALYEGAFTKSIFGYNDILALDFNVPTEGEYGVELNGLQVGNFGMKAVLYVDDVYVGEVDFAHPDYTNVDSEAEQKFTAKLNPLALSEGKHTLYIKRINNDSHRHHTLWLYNMKLTDGEGIPQVKELKVDVASKTILKGGSSRIDTKVIMTDDSEYIFAPKLDGSQDQKNVLTIKCENENIIKVENGIITAIEEGSTVIHVLAYVNGKEYKKDVSVKVVAVPEGAFELVASSLFPVRVDKKAEVVLQGAMSNVIVDLDKAEKIEIANDSPEIVQAEIIRRDGKTLVQVKGISEGDAEIVVSATLGGFEDAVTIPVSVREQVSSKRARVLNFAANAASYEELTIEKHGWSVNMEKTPAAIFERANSTLYQNWRTKLHLEYGEAFFVNFPVEESGYYSLDLAGTQVEMYGLVAAFYIDDEFVGEYNFSDPNGEDEEIQGVVEHFRDIYMEEGVHELKILRINDTDYRHAFLWLENLKFTPVAKPATIAGINVECEKDKLLLGDTVKADFSLRMSDGNNYHFPSMVGDQGKLNVTALIEDCVSYKDNTISANGAGTGILQISASTPELENYTGYWQITTADGQLFDFRRVGKTVQATDINIVEENWQVNLEKTAAKIVSANPFCLSGENGFYAHFRENEILALDINILKDGVYDVDAVGTLVGNHGAELAFYMDDTYLGKYNFVHPDGDINDIAETRNVTEKFNSVELKKGRHTLYIKRINGGSYRHNMMYLNRLVLTEAENLPEVASISIQADSTEVVYKHTLQPNVTVWMTNGREYLFGNKIDGTPDDKNILSFSSSDTNVFTVDANSGLMTGVWVGNAEFIAQATVRGEKYDQSHEFSTIRVLKLAAENELFVTRTESASTQLSAVLDDLPVNLSEATDIQVIPDDPKYIEGIVVKTDDAVRLQITGLRAGESSVTVKATLDDVVGSVEVPVHIFAPIEGKTDLDMNFVMYSDSPNAATIASDGWSVNRKETSEYVLNGQQWSLNSMGLSAQMQYGDLLVLDFFVRESGNYALDMYGAQVGNFGLVADVYIDDMYMGQFNFAHPSDADSDAVNERNVLARLNSLMLTTGSHKITLKRVNADTHRHSYVYLSAFDFTKLDGDLYYADAVAEVKKDNLVVGESTEVTIGAQMSDGSWRNMGALIDGSEDTKNKLTVNNSNPSVAEIIDGRVVAKAEGDTTITAIAKVDGIEKSASVQVHVSDAKISQVTATIPEDVYVGKSVDLDINAKASNGVDIDASCLSIATVAEDPTIVSVNGATITGLSAGETNITVTAGFGDDNSASTTIPVVVLEDGLVGIKVNAIPRLIRPDSEGTQITVTGGSFHGQPIDLTGAEITYTTQATDIIDLSPGGYVTPKALGSALVKVKVVANGGAFTDEGEINIIVTNGKVGRTYYTDEKVEALQENSGKYAWARSEASEIVRTAEKYLGLEEMLWEAVTTQELPRAVSVGLRYDPEIDYCRYCGKNLSLVYGNPIYSYNIDPINTPWKVQCKECRRKFPSNDFGSFYKLGIDEHGNWDYELAHREHYMLFAQEYAEKGVETYESYNSMRLAGERLPAIGYLKNQLYPEVETVNTINVGKGLLEGETVEGWGVDDGYGYKTGHVYKNTNWGDVKETHTYIAMYNRAIMGTADLFDTVAQSLSQAYMITGDAKYGRVCAIVLDRLADVYPDMIIEKYREFNNTNGGGERRGKLEGGTWEADTPWKWAMAYDAVWPMYDDPYVINFLSEKAKKYNMDNKKSTPELIRQNIEDGILRQIYIGCMNGDIHGNFGLHQTPLATAAVVLDTMPETKEMLDYLMRYDENYLIYSGGHTGGEVLHKIYNDVNSDGGTAEGNSPNYQNLWYNSIAYIADVLNGYQGYAAADLYKNPKVSKMLKNQMNYIMCRRTSLPVGDSGVMAGLEIMLPGDVYLMNAYRATGDIEFAQMVYWQNGNKVDGLHQDIYTKNPEAIQQDVLEVIDKYGEYDFDKSSLLAGTGFAVLRDGSLHAEGTVDEYDNQRDFWMNFGLKGIHGHADTLGLGLHAYGLDFAPDFGYPYPSDLSDHHRSWGMSSISHNLVIVNARAMTAINTAATPLHFDSTDRIKLMDVDAAEVYSDTEKYRRTVVMIEANDDISYGVDFFRIKGGDEHVYSFHASSHEIGEIAGFKAIQQDGGSYAGEDVAFQSGGYPNGYSYLTDVRRDNEVNNGEVMVEFNITDYRKAIKDSSDMHLRLTMLNDFNLSEVALAKGEPPRKTGNPKWIEFFLARRSGKNLDTTFTTVIEPYQGDRYIKATEQVSIERVGGEEEKADDVARAIKVTLANGREDYVIYATNNQVEYIVDGDIRFRGFVGVYTLSNGEMLNAYLNHGTKIGEVESVSEYNGEIVDFTRGATSFDNQIIVSFNDAENVDLGELAGRHIYVENDGAMNGIYAIKNATENTDGTVSLGIAEVTLVRSATNITAEDADYVYNIAPKQYFEIPLSVYKDTAPVFAEHESDYSLIVGREFSETVVASCTEGRNITYSSKALPRGARIDSTTGEVTWKPDSSQVGKNHISICADDGVSQTTIHLNLTVYKSSGSATPSIPSAPSGGGSAGGGGGSTTPSTPSTPTTPETPDEPTTPDAPATGEGEGAGDAPETPAEKFVDLGNHTWAEDAIYTLVDKGVVNGTSSNTYAPANNIKRADFAIMLVRAFGITEGEGENFADVDSNKYYAEELRLAKAAGIVNGVGNDKFNPEGEITRQDMMLMLSRALDAMEVELSDADLSALADFADAAQISDYAADAVSRMIKDGIIAGSNGKINPLAKATRAEIAVMLDRVLAK